MINVLIVHASGEGSTLTRMTALVWLNRFLDMHSVGPLQYLSSYLTAVLPSLSDPQLKGICAFYRKWFLCIKISLAAYILSNGLITQNSSLVPLSERRVHYLWPSDIAFTIYNRMLARRLQ